MLAIFIYVSFRRAISSLACCSCSCKSRLCIVSKQVYTNDDDVDDDGGDDDDDDDDDDDEVVVDNVNEVDSVLSHSLDRHSSLLMQYG